MHGTDHGRRADHGRGGDFGRIPPQAIRNVVAQTDMLAVVREVVELKKAGSSFKGCCPFHAEKTPSFHVNPGLKLYHCYGCSAGGDVIRFVQETRGLNFVEAVELLAERVGITLERVAERPEDSARRAEAKSARGRMLELDRAAQAWFRGRLQLPEGRNARAYAESRGLTTATIERFGLGAAGTGWTDLLDHLTRLGFQREDIVAIGLAKIGDKGGTYDRFRDRLMFPIYTSAGDLVGFGGRDLTGEKEVAKYINSSEITLDGEEENSRFRHFYKKGDCVFGLWQARDAIRTSKTAIVVEGNLDVITLAQAGFETAVCAMGTALTDAQAKEIKRFADRVALVFDGDNAGRKAAMKAVPVVVAAGLEGSYVVLPQGEDPDSFVRKFGVEAFRELLANAPPLIEGYIDALVAESDHSLQANALILQKAGPLLSAIQDGISRDMARNHLQAQLTKGAIEPHRATFDRYLQGLAPPSQKTEPQQPARPDPTFGEPEVGKLEQDLCAVLVWYPALCGQAMQYGALDLLDHAGVRLALRDLAAVAREQEVDPDTLSGWAQALPDGRARRLILRLLVEEPLCKPGQAQGWLVQVTWRLQERQLKQQREQVTTQMKSRDVTPERLAELSSQLGDIMRRLQEFAKAGARQAVEAASGI
jgi:DNA primase